MILLNGEIVKFGLYPNGETNLSKRVFDGMGDKWEITLQYQNDSDLIQLMFVKEHLDNKNYKAALIINYMPYSRMDRENYDYVFTLKAVCRFINSLNFFSVTVIEPHSDVTPALLDRCNIVNWCDQHLTKVICMSGFDIDKDVIFFPDAGAEKRYFIQGFNSVTAIKERDFQTGKITEYNIAGTLHSEARRVLIIDDLCSRGGTFIEAAKEIRHKLPIITIDLMVAHCEENVFTGDLFDHIRTLYTSTKLSKSHPQIKEVI
ncbi:MAG: ribose-phosphate pyrophosphokinase [Candidatus Anammoxibacter sp.]